MKVENHPFTSEEIYAAAMKDKEKFFYIIAPTQGELVREIAELELECEKAYVSADKKCIFALWKREEKEEEVEKVKEKVKETKSLVEKVKKKIGKKKSD